MNATPTSRPRKVVLYGGPWDGDVETVIGAEHITKMQDAGLEFSAGVVSVNGVEIGEARNIHVRRLVFKYVPTTRRDRGGLEIYEYLPS